MEGGVSCTDVTVPSYYGQEEREAGVSSCHLLTMVEDGSVLPQLIMFKLSASITFVHFFVSPLESLLH